MQVWGAKAERSLALVISRGSYAEPSYQACLRHQNMAQPAPGIVKPIYDILPWRGTA